MRNESFKELREREFQRVREKVRERERERENKKMNKLILFGFRNL